MAGRKNKASPLNFDSLLLPAEQALSDARGVFLDTLSITVPELLQELERDVLAVFRTIPSGVKEETNCGPQTANWSGDKPVLVRLPNIWLWRNLVNYEDVNEVVATRNAILRWAAPRNLDAPWLLDSALLTLEYWTQAETNPTTEEDPLFEGRLHFIRVNPEVFEITSHTVDYRHPAWKPLETWRDYEKQQVKAFAAHLAEHKASQMAHDYGLPADINNYDHFVWMALAYGKQMNFRQIADLPKKDRSSHIAGTHASECDFPGEDTVRKAVQSKAQLIGLPKLRTVRGRPPRHRTENRN